MPWVSRSTSTLLVFLSRYYVWAAQSVSAFMKSTWREYTGCNLLLIVWCVFNQDTAVEKKELTIALLEAKNSQFVQELVEQQKLITRMKRHIGEKEKLSAGQHQKVGRNWPLVGNSWLNLFHFESECMWVEINARFLALYHHHQLFYHFARPGSCRKAVTNGS